jgi:hypothetical protein
MKHPPTEPDSKVSPGAPPLRRRGILLGASVAAVAGAAAVAASRALQASAPEPAVQAKKDTEAEGYRLSEHVLRYYETARV